jgi:hypothetical protein
MGFNSGLKGLSVFVCICTLVIQHANNISSAQRYFVSCDLSGYTTCFHNISEHTTHVLIFSTISVSNISRSKEIQQDITIHLHKSSRKVRHAVEQLVEALQVGMSRVRFPILSLEFFINIILSAVLWL